MNAQPFIFSYNAVPDVPKKVIPTQVKKAKREKKVKKEKEQKYLLVGIDRHEWTQCQLWVSCEVVW